jgi:hypothetical protein
MARPAGSRWMGMGRKPLPAALRKWIDALVAEPPDADPREVAEMIRCPVAALDPPTSPPAHATARDLRAVAYRLER